MKITVFMVQSENGIINTVTYFDEKERMCKADFSAAKLKAEKVDNEKLARMIEAHIALYSNA